MSGATRQRPVFAAYVEGFTNPFWIWNCVPIAVSYLLLSRARQKKTNPLPEIAFFVIACGVVMITHAAWFYDWTGVATGSSTAGLMFVVLPVYACALGGATNINPAVDDPVATRNRISAIRSMNC